MKTDRLAVVERDAQRVISLFKSRSMFHEVIYTIKDRADGPYLVLELLNPTERFYGIVENISKELVDDNLFAGRVTIKKRFKPPVNRLSLPETALLQKVIAESLTATSSTFGDEYLDRYIRSVSGAEEQITARSNNIVLGRRGSGKSSLLLYAMHKLKEEQTPYTWTTIQTYEGRKDFLVVVDIFLDIVSQLAAKCAGVSLMEMQLILSKLEGFLDEGCTEKQFDVLVPRVRRAFSAVVRGAGQIVLFLDDIHVLHETMQIMVLSKLYSITRDNSVFLKISGIEQLAKNWNASLRKGIETPHDAQVIKLDHNLTMPGKSLDHISSILDARATYCGLPSIGYICGSEVIQRLVWVAAGVPRDALSIFSSAASRAAIKDQKRVSITSVNEAASVMAETKINDLALDASDRKPKIEEAFDVVRKFCISEQKKNAFLVEIGSNGPAMSLVKELIGLRLLHILHEGVTPHQAVRRYMGLMLDYGFYVGIRAARSVDVFQKEPDEIAAKDLRNLPIFPLNLIAPFA